MMLGYDARLKRSNQKKPNLDIPDKFSGILPEFPVSFDPDICRRSNYTMRMMDESRFVGASPIEAFYSANLAIQCAQESDGFIMKINLVNEEHRYIPLSIGHDYSLFSSISEYRFAWFDIGFDVIQIQCLQSGLFRGGYSAEQEKYVLDKIVTKLNRYGLFHNCADAMDFANIRSNQIPEHSPFSVVQISIGSSNYSGYEIVDRIIV